MHDSTLHDNDVFIRVRSQYPVGTCRYPSVVDWDNTHNKHGDIFFTRCMFTLIGISRCLIPYVRSSSSDIYDLSKKTVSRVQGTSAHGTQHTDASSYVAASSQFRNSASFFVPSHKYIPLSLINKELHTRYRIRANDSSYNL